jgi:hypothetical protein
LEHSPRVSSQLQFRTPPGFGGKQLREIERN